MLDESTNHLSKARAFYHLHYSNYAKLYHSIIINIRKWIMITLRTSLHDENILAPTLLRLEEILFFELNAIFETLRRDESFSYFASRWEILNDKFLDIWISKFRIGQ